MEIKKYLISFFAILFLLSVTVIAQEEMTTDEWEAEMTRLKDKKESLTKEISVLQNEVNNLKATKLQSYEDCVNELYAMVGGTKADVDNYRKAVTELDGKIRRKEGPKVDRQKDLDALKMNKISALPEFFDKVHNQMQRSLDSWVEEVKETMYTVVRGDHLWGIARKSEHYGNGFAWPMIYKANRDKIKNPDLIYPKQVFSIPKLTEEEKAKYDKIRKNYKPAPVQ
ncbi:MAG: peptidoglycan-binding protein LysM [Ignavibacteria bacterium RIFOXYB2_FULL_35_12]|nr:MAG: peptidoglycan-binding protein LysM [Ignavibacteria bacterium GWA2_36_19]OGU55534.1 MAG: peptidoglycan-binding protein LysM [Ignavibacteria bacterium GWC2_35_8]OGU61507.1 MAG: peptidoglycan-binding protein LysM [Ignavibacteria bacterium GWF2_35_20]OGU80035.1 MAG: peptidoglycan-binding protein LysM [Ignavibacteria bacterium RBG_16_35_7]OGU80994.1 MAG: peptidoglycan-binding protein LysM [Ignavibacteria bacterium RIFOXYA2_FULL_35_9]OGU85539.1 MAG: peptidoglycan-binding protein LysM [Ignavi